MNITSSSTGGHQAARALLNELQGRFPVIAECKPLAIGIDKQLIGQLPEVDRKALRMALSFHTGSIRYLKVMAKATVRFNLDGSQAGEVDDAHRKHAAEILRERFKQASLRKKAEAEEEKAQQRRTEKLQQLAEKFSPRR